MSLAELMEEYERQQAVPIRRFTCPGDLLDYITGDAPPLTEKVTIDMCVLNVEEFDLCWHIEMIAKSDDDFKERKAIISKLDEVNRANYVFCLSLWKAKKQSRDHVTGADYIPGRTYVVTNVKGLRIYRNAAQGSVQAKYVVKNESDEPRNKNKRKAKEAKP